jgi:hypothetical protein
MSCAHVRTDGSACRNLGPRDDAGFCVAHSQQPDFVAQRTEMQRRATEAATKARKQRAAAAHIPELHRIEDATEALAWIALAVSSKKLNSKDAQQATSAVVNWSRLQGYRQQLAELTKQYKKLAREYAELKRTSQP